MARGMILFVLCVFSLFLLANAAFASDAATAYRSSSGSGTSYPKVRFWNSSGSGSWGSEIELASAGSPVREAVIKQSPVSRKIILVTESDDGYLDAYVCPGNCTYASSWVQSTNIGQVWSSAPGTHSRRFDVGFETSSGRALVIYAANDSDTTHDIAYKILSPNVLSFSGITEQYLDDVDETNNIQYTWISTDAKPVSSSNELALIGYDSNYDDVNAWIWNGSAWGNYQELSSNSAGTNGREDIAVKYSADGTRCMAVGGGRSASGPNARQIDYMYWNGTGWSTPATIASVTSANGRPAQWLTLKADPATDDLQLVVVDTGPQVNTAYWSGSAWTAQSGISAVDTVTSRSADFEWMPTGSTGRLVWDSDGSGSALSQRLCSPQCTGTINTTSTYNGNGTWLALYRNPTSSDTVKILGERMNSSNALGSFSWSGSAYSNYGDTAIASSAGVTTFESFTIAFQLNSSAFDYTPPSIALNSPANDSRLNYSTVDFNFTATDDFPNNMNCSLYLDGSLNQSNASTVNNTLTNLTVAGISQGSHTWYINCTDNGSNSNVSQTWTLFIDTQDPVVALGNPTNHFNSSSQNINFSFTPTDNLAANMSCALLIDGTTVATNGTTANNTLTTIQATGILEGKHIWLVECNDTVNRTGSSAYRNFTVDLTPPSIALSFPGNNTVQPKSIGFIFTATDNLSSEMRCAIFLDGVYNQTNVSTKNNTATTFQINNISTGAHNWSIACNDSANNSAASQTWYFTAASLPTVSLTSPATSSNLNTTNVNFNFNVTDEVYTTLNCSILIDGTWNATNASTLNATATIFPVSGFTQGLHNWSVSCNNSVPLQGTSATRDFTVDTAAPSVTLNLPANGFNTSSTTVNLNFTATDNLAGTMACALFLDGVANATNPSVANNTLTNFQVTSIAQGRHNWTVSCNDSANNGASAALRNFTVDTAAPAVALNLPANGYATTSSVVSFNFTVTDNLAPIMSCALYVDGAVSATNSNVANNTLLNINIGSLTQGLHNWSVSCNDSVPNTGSSAVRNFTVDSTPPTVTLNLPANNLNTSSTAITFNFTATDNLAATMSCALLIDNVVAGTNASVLNNTLTNIPASGIAQGRHNWTVSCNDSANMSASAAPRNFTVDTSAPTVTLNLPVNYYNTSSTAISFNFTATDNIAQTMSCALLIDNVVAGTNASVLNNTLTNIPASGIAQGRHNWTVSCNDSVPNAGSAAVRNFTVDTTPPAVVLNLPPNNQHVNTSSINFNFTAVDNLSTQMNCSIFINGVYQSSNSSVQNNTATLFSFVGLADGLLNWSVNCTDRAGNIGASPTWNLTIDTTPPSVSLNSPADGATINTSSALFNFTATDSLSLPLNCSLYIDGVRNQTNASTLNNTPTTFNVSNFSLGSHSWNVTCRDGVNNTGSSANRTFFMAAVTYCPVITSGGSYLQVSNLQNAPNSVSPPGIGGGYSGVCVKIAASNVIYDCNGYNITNDGTNNRIAMFLNGSISNITVKNCAGISAYKAGIYAINTNDSYFINNFIYGHSTNGIHHEDCYYNSFINNTVMNSTQMGIDILRGAFNFFINNTLIENKNDGIHVAQSDNSLFEGNRLLNNTQDGIQVVQNTNNTFRSNTALQNKQNGLHIVGTTTNLFVNNTMNYNTHSGMYSASSTGSSFYNNTACHNGQSGFTFASSSVEHMVNNTACSNAQAGIALSDSDYATLIGNHYYNNTPDFDDISSGTRTMNSTCDIFDSPGDNYQNYTNLSINDTESGSTFTISWAPPPPSLPTSCQIFLNKFINITNTSGSVVIDTITWHWLPSELAGFDMSLFKIAVYNGSTWEAVPDQYLDIGSDSITIYNLSKFGVLGIVGCNSSMTALKAAQNASVVNGTNATFTINVTNTGNATLDPVLVVDILPDGLIYAGASPAPDSVAGNNITWNNVGPIAAGASAIITLNATANVTNESVTVVNWAYITATDPIAFNLTANSSAAVTLIAPEEEEKPDHDERLKAMDLSYGAACPGDTMMFNATYSDDPVQGASIRVIYDEYPAYYLLGVLTTSSNGTASTHFASNGTYHVRATRTGFYPYEMDIEYTTCRAGCQADAECADGAVCEDGSCKAIKCDCGRAMNHTCVKYACCVDGDCPKGQRCEAHECVLKYECVKDSDCSDNEYCKIPAGAEGGTCEQVIGCGFADNHRLVPYQCGTEPGCPPCPSPSELCENHACVMFGLTGPAQGFIGENVTLHATKGNGTCADCELRIVQPDGKAISGKTDGKGDLVLPLTEVGNYTASLMGPSVVVRTLSIAALAKPAPVEPEKGLPMDLCLMLLLLLLLLLLAYYLWKRREKEVAVAALTKAPIVGKPVELIARRGGSKKPAAGLQMAVTLKGKQVAKGATDAAGRFAFTPDAKGEYAVFVEGRKSPSLTLRV